MKTLLASAALAALLTTTATAEDWALDKAASSVEARLTVFNAPAIATFDQFDADITLDPADLSGASIRASVHAPSALVTNREGEAVGDYQTALEGRTGLNVASYETLTFRSDTITATDTGYAASGLLTVRDVTLDVVLTFTLDITGDRAVAEGGFTLSREALGLTNSSWGSNVADAIEVNLLIEAERVSSPS